MPDLPYMQFLADSVAASADPPFECSRAEGGMDAAWVHVACVLDIATTPQLVETLDAPVQSPVLSLQRSLVSSSLLKSGDRHHGHGPSH